MLHAQNLRQAGNFVSPYEAGLNKILNSKKMNLGSRDNPRAILMHSSGVLFPSHYKFRESVLVFQVLGSDIVVQRPSIIFFQVLLLSLLFGLERGSDTPVTGVSTRTHLANLCPPGAILTLSHVAASSNRHCRVPPPATFGDFASL